MNLGRLCELKTEDVLQALSFFVVAPDGKGNVLFVLWTEETRPAICCFQPLTSFPFPPTAILDECF